MSLLGTPDYDSGLNPTIAGLVADGFTSTGTPTDVPTGVSFDHASADGFHIALPASNRLFLVDATLAADFDSSGAVRAIAGTSEDAAATFLREVAGISNTGSTRRASLYAAGNSNGGPTDANHFFTSSAGVFKAVIFAGLGQTLKHTITAIRNSLKNVDWKFGIGGIPSREDFYLGGGNTGLGYGSNIAAPVIINQVRWWDFEASTYPTPQQIDEALGVLALGGSSSIVAQNVLSFTSKTATAVTLGVTHPASAAGGTLQYKSIDSKLWIIHSFIDSGTSSVTISGLTASGIYEFVVLPQEDTGEIGPISRTLRVDMATGATLL